MSRTLDRIANWSVSSDGTFRFVYQGYKFYVTPDNMQDVLRDIGRMAANPVCDLDWQDAEYLTSLIREVLNGQTQPIAKQTCDCDECRSQRIGEFIWMLAMGVCSAAFWVALISFIVWGLR